jgi:hypothetical protein
MLVNNRIIRRPTQYLNTISLINCRGQAWQKNARIGTAKTCFITSVVEEHTLFCPGQGLAIDFTLKNSHLIRILENYVGVGCYGLCVL